MADLPKSFEGDLYNSVGEIEPNKPYPVQELEFLLWAILARDPCQPDAMNLLFIVNSYPYDSIVQLELIGKGNHKEDVWGVRLLNYPAANPTIKH